MTKMNKVINEITDIIYAYMHDGKFTRTNPLRGIKSIIDLSVGTEIQKTILRLLEQLTIDDRLKAFSIIEKIDFERL